MPETGQNVYAFYQCVSRLGLTHAEDDTYMGRYADFPIAVTRQSVPGELDLTTGDREPPTQSVFVQIRYVGVPEDTMITAEETGDPTIRRLRDEKRIRISFDTTIAWITVDRADVSFLESELNACLDAVLQIIRRAGGKGDGGNCHYCRARSVASLTWVEERVAQVCTPCLEEKLEEADRERRGDPAGYAALFLCATMATCVGALCWVLFWWLDAILVAWATPKYQTEIHVPYLLVFAEFVAIGLAIGAVVGLLTTLTRRAGGWLPPRIAATASFASAILGEFAIRWIRADAALLSRLPDDLPALPAGFDDGAQMEVGYRLCAMLLAAGLAALIAVSRSK
ncbi:MAG TPA: hypothetical protein P5081_20760 [Phycisphaerae bacterium]|nr:hypothetical protein [Phycisphaerae bacterium]HRW55312.1 hypothetical protein [Phycisphaerae bacterium]